MNPLNINQRIFFFWKTPGVVYLMIFDVLRNITTAWSALSFSYASLFYFHHWPALELAKDCNVIAKCSKYVRIESQESFQTEKEFPILYYLFFFQYPIINYGMWCVFTGCPKSALEGLVTLGEEWGRFTQRGISIRQRVRRLCLLCHPTADTNPDGQSQPSSSHRKSPHAVSQTSTPPPTPDPQSCVLPAHRCFWEVTISFYHPSCFIAGLADFRVIIPPPAPELSVLSQMARKEATSLTVEDSVLVAVSWLHWSGKVAAAWRVTTYKIWDPGMPSES